MKTSDNYKQILTTYKLDHPDMDAISGFTLGLHAIGYECTTEDESPMIYT